MGRVYNALLKADRLSDDLPIARPARSHAAIEREGASFAKASTGHDVDSKQKSDKASSQFNLDGAAAAPAFESQKLFPATQTKRSHVDRTAAPSPQPNAANQSGNRANAFEEPRKVARVEELKIDAHLAVIAGGDKLAAERYRTLAVRLGNLAARRKLKSLVITSATFGEGKTTVAINLAWALAKQSERRVLLVDANLNAPSAARMLGVEPTRGWLEMTEGKSSAADSIIRIDPNGLYIASPRASSDESKNDVSFASSHIEKLIAQTGNGFDLIVIDAPALLESADAERLASIADGAVLVARACHTRRDRVSDAIALIPEDRRLGVVLNESMIDSENSRDQSKGRLFGRKSKRAGRR